MNDVILYLTSPSNKIREENSLKNLKQLHKLNKDIIVLSTHKIYNPEFYNLAKLVVYDFYNVPFDKKFYKKALEYPTPYQSPYGSFYYIYSNYTYIIYVQSHFSSLCRNTKILIQLAKSFDYKNFFYVEDDHYFSDDGLKKIEEYFINLNNNELNAIYFSNVWDNMNIIQSYFWFGNVSYFNESIISKMPSCYEDVSSQFPYTCSYESLLYYIFYETTFNKNKIQFEDVGKNSLISLFGTDSKLNQYYSYCNITDDSRISIVYNKQINGPTLLFFLNDLKMEKDINVIEIKSNNKTFHTFEYHVKNPFYVYWLNININQTPDLQIYMNGKFLKEFINLNMETVKNNGYCNS